MKKFKTIFIVLTTAGFIFSGYMSGVKLFSNTCAFGETCPLFLGMPACYIGFILFLALFIVSLLFIINKQEPRKISNKFIYISTLGVIYSLFFALPELPALFNKGFGAYAFGLPTCVMGSVFFVAIFIVSIIFYRQVRKV